MSLSLSPSPTNTDHLLTLVRSARSHLHLKQIHAHLLRRRHRYPTPRLAAQLIAASAPLRCIPFALALFRHSPHAPTNPVLDALIRALSDTRHFSLAAQHFALFATSNLRPGRLAFPFALRSAAALRSPSLASSLHAAAVKPALDLDPFVRTSIADAYVKLNLHHSAIQLFDQTPDSHKHSNPLLYNIAINASSSSGATDRAREIFNSMPGKRLSSWNTLIHGLISKADVHSATEVFEEMPERNVITWTTMIAGLSRNGECGKALSMFERMVEAGERPNEYTVTSAVSACSRIGALEAGVRIHEYVMRMGHRVDGVVGTAIVDMYSKCGKIECAVRVFDKMAERDVLAWTAMIMGYAMQGQWKDAMQCFEDMKCSGVKPDEGAFLAVIMACSHSGKVGKGIKMFDSMRSEYRIKPNIKHYTCIVDLLGKAGRLEEAVQIIKAMPIEPDYKLWGALFCACRAHKNVPLAEMAAEKLLKLKPVHSGGYVFLQNVYAGTGNWEAAEKVRAAMKQRSVAKTPGWSNIEIEGVTHQFVAGDRSHLCLREINKKLEELEIRVREEGYKPNTEWVVHNIEEEDKEENLGCHSEKLALAFGLIMLSEGAEIRIVKNIRVCGDCHSFMKFASKICRRDILLRDNKRFHQFREGECSCRDYW